MISCVGLDGPYIAISSDPSSGEFTKIANNSDLFNYPAYHYYDSIYGGSIWEIIEYNGSLYVAICTGTPDNKSDENTMQSFAIVRGDCNGDPEDPDSWTWTSVVGDQANGSKYTFGIDPERTRAGACNLVEYNGYLYIGEYNDEEIALENILFEKDASFMAENLRQSVSIYRMDKDENIELVVGNATDMFPNGGISGLGSGFGKNENQYIWQSAEYDGKLYFGTFDTSSLLEPLGQFTNGDLLHLTKEEWKLQIDYLRVLFEVMIEKQYKTEETDLVDEYAETEESSVITEEEAAQMIADAENNVLASAPAEINTDGVTVTQLLTDEQRAQMIQEIINGILNESFTEDDLEAMYELNSEMLEAYTDISETFSQEFADRYQSFVENYQTFKSVLCTKLQEYYDKLLSGIDNLKDFAYIMKVLSTAERGFDLYVTEDGTNFSTITTNGLGDPYNHGLRVFATLPDYLLVGTANPFYGTQLWRMHADQKAAEHSITVKVDGKGSASASQTSAKEGRYITLSAAAESGYTFVGWKVESGNVTVNQNNGFYMPDGDVVISAIFTKDAQPTSSPAVTEKPASTPTSAPVVTVKPVSSPAAAEAASTAQAKKDSSKIVDTSDSSNMIAYAVVMIGALGVTITLIAYRHKMAG